MSEAVKEYIKSKHNGEIPYRYSLDECVKLMTDYHKEQLEKELIKFCDDVIADDLGGFISTKRIKEYINKLKK